MTNDPSKPDHAAPRVGVRARLAALAAAFRASPAWDPATRAAHSLWQAAAAVWFVAGALPAAGLGSVPWVAGLVAGGTAAVTSLAMSAATWKVPEQRSRVNDVLRYARTFVAALAGTWVASEATVLTFDWQGASLAALLATVGSVVKTKLVNGDALARDTIDLQIAARRDPDALRAQVTAALAEHGVEPID